MIQKDTANPLSHQVMASSHRRSLTQALAPSKHSHASFERKYYKAITHNRFYHASQNFTNLCKPHLFTMRENV